MLSEIYNRKIAYFLHNSRTNLYKIMSELSGAFHKAMNNGDNQPTIVQEGKARVSFSSSLDVFYNPVQEFNRDLSIAVIRLAASDYGKIREFKSKIETKLHPKFALCNLKPADFKVVQSNAELLPPHKKYEDGIKILEALAASGLRSIRYAQEIGGVKEIIANDYSESAVKCIQANIQLNSVEELVSPSLDDANLVMYKHIHPEKRFQVVDIDPYGSPHIFLETAVQCVEDGGILLVTATDMAVLCGKYPEACYSKYGTVPTKMSACHEMALRILLKSIEEHANKYGRYIEPLVSLSVDFYCRVIVRVFTSKKLVKDSFTKIGMLHICVGCDSVESKALGKKDVDGNSVKYFASELTTSVKCEHCGHKKKTAGPLWLEQLHDKSFVKRLNESLVEEDFKTYKRMVGMLTLAEQELDVPFYLVLPHMFQACKIGACKMIEVMSPLLNAGYKVSLTHAKPNCFKTNAPMSTVWDVFRELNSRNPVPADKWPPGHTSTQILNKKITTKLDMSTHPEADSIMKDRSLIRFQSNPEKFWGPKCRSKTSIFHDDMQSKRARKQGKRKHKKIIGNSPECKKVKPECQQ